MGRPLKIKKTSIVNAGYPQYGNISDGTPPASPWTSQDFVGVVGGMEQVATATFPVANVTVYLTGSSEQNGVILRQKGQSTFLVAQNTTVYANALVAGRSYVINTVGTTNWGTVGAGGLSKGNNPSVTTGDIFTATGAGTGTGTAQLAGRCVLANVSAGNLTPGTMTATVTTAGNTSVLLNRITDHWGIGFDGTQYLLNFFEASANTAVKAGIDTPTSTTGDDTVPMVVLNNYTS